MYQVLMRNLNEGDLIELLGRRFEVVDSAESNLYSSAWFLRLRDSDGNTYGEHFPYDCIVDCVQFVPVLETDSAFDCD